MKTSKKINAKSHSKKVGFVEIITRILTVIITPFYFVYRILFALPRVCSPIIGLVRGVTFFVAICLLTSPSGYAFKHKASEFLSAFMTHSIAEFLVASIGGLCAIMFLVSVLILLGFHMEMEYTGDPSELSGAAGNPYPNIHRAMKDFDGRLGFGTVYGLAAFAKKVLK